MIHLPTSIESRRLAVAFAISIACVATLLSAHAMAEPTAAERSLAAALFEQGRTLMTDGKIDEACIKLAESHRLDPGGGTLLNLASCHQRQGKFASAWTEFREARAIAVKDGRADREAMASSEIEKLEPLLSRVSVVVPPEAKIAGLIVEIDGMVVPEAGWGTPFTIDPGKHAVVVKAQGYREERSSFEIDKAAMTTTVNVPKLTKESATTPPPGLTPSATASGSSPSPIASSASGVGPDAPKNSIRRLGFVIGGLGLTFIGVGAVTGAMAIKNDRKADENCGGSTCSNQADVDLSKEALTIAHVSTATFGVGIAGAIAGGVMILAAPQSVPGRVSLFVGPSSVSVTGKF